jgi:hypothetical protein
MNGKSFLDVVSEMPMIPPGTNPLIRGRMTHVIVKHDEWCRTLNGGTGADCNCNPDVTYHLQPLPNKSRQ